MFSLQIYFFLLSLVVCNALKSRLVHLSQGPVRGYKDYKNDLFTFYSIPYAKVPTGFDRFKAPLPPPHWSETFEAVEKNIVCPQVDYRNMVQKSKKNVQANCLIANIFVPETNKKKLPVVVHIHGGSYFMGWGNLATPKNLVKSKKVIAVTFNYRLGPHGFLCLGTKDVPGNAGMKDQVALLRWVNKNIASFGGDPNDVTLAGYSAGSKSVDLLMISKMTRGLFKRVIPQSGAGIAAFQLDPIENAKKYAQLIGFNDVDNFNALKNFYKNVTYEVLNSPISIMNSPNTSFLMSPCVERYVGEEMFLDDNPVNILKTGNFVKLPMLYGFSEMEGLFRISLFEEWKNRMNEKFSDFLPTDLHFKDEIEKEVVAQEIKTFYFDNEIIGDETVLAYVKYFTDIIFTYPILRSVNLQIEAGNNEIFLYEYSYVDNYTPIVPHTDIRGAYHCSQAFAVLDDIWNPINSTFMDEEFASQEFKEMKGLIREIWLNFMTSGKPMPEASELHSWPPVHSDWSPHMSINKSLELRGSVLRNRTLFWDRIYDKYYHYPLPPMSQPEDENLS